MSKEEDWKEIEKWAKEKKEADIERDRIRYR